MSSALTRRRARAIVRAMFDEHKDVHQVAQEHKLDVRQLLELIHREGLDDELGDLARLQDLQNQVMFSRMRRHALARLMQISEGQAGDEIARKAAVEIIRANPHREPRVKTTREPRAQRTHQQIVADVYGTTRRKDES